MSRNKTCHVVCPMPIAPSFAQHIYSAAWIQPMIPDVLLPALPDFFLLLLPTFP